MFKFLKFKKNPPAQPFQLHNLIEILQDGVCIANLAGEIIYLNKAAYLLLGIYKADDLSKYNFFTDCIADYTKVEFFKQQINQYGLVRNYEMQLKKISGGRLDVILTLNTIGDFRQQTIGFLFLFKDVSELKKIQEQLLQSQKLESIGLMASGIAHDFNNILAAIIPNAELIKIATQSDDDNFKRAEIIEKSALRASDIAQRLLTFTRHNDYGAFLSFNMNQVIEECIDLLKNSILKDVVVQKELFPNLSLLKGDATQMQQIIVNLMINSIDAMPGGGKILLKTDNIIIKNHYEIGSLDPGDYVRFLIKDTGTGIPMDELPKIFDPFYTTKDIGKGTGLGLSVVYGIVKSFGGHIEVGSKVNEGTKFVIYFPAEPAVSKEIETEKRGQKKTKRIHILVVDDEDYVLNILSDILKFLGYQVTQKASGQEAVEFYEENQNTIDYSIIDLKMPKMDGRATARELRNINQKAKIIFTSGFDDHPEGNENFDYVAGFIKKPYSINQVAQSLEEIFTK